MDSMQGMDQYARAVGATRVPSLNPTIPSQTEAVLGVVTCWRCKAESVGDSSTNSWASN